MNLHQLRIFRAVAKSLSYSRAAKALFLTQPAVSMQVKALEQSIGLPLLERTGRTITLTEAGRTLLAYSERIFSLMDETQLVLDELRGARRGLVKVAASTTAGIYIVPTALGAFHQDHPDVQLTLDVGNRFAVQERLLSGEVDLAIMGLIEDAHALEVAEFMPNQLVVIASPRHPLASRREIPLRELGEETILLREAGSGTRTDVERLFAAQGVTLRLGMELRSIGAIKQAVAARLGISVMPRSALAIELEIGRLVTLDVVGFPVQRYWSLVRHSGRRFSAVAGALWGFLLSYRSEAMPQTSARGADLTQSHGA